MLYFKNSSLGYIISFVAVFLFLFFIYHVFFQDYLVIYYSFLASSLCYVFSLFDSSVTCQGIDILYDGMPSLRIVEGCDGIAFIVLIVAAVLPFSRSLKQRLIGILVLIPTLFIINWLRIAVLAILKFYFSENYFNFVHIYVFQPVMIFLTLGCFIIWINYTDERVSAEKT